MTVCIYENKTRIGFMITTNDMTNDNEQDYRQPAKAHDILE